MRRRRLIAASALLVLLVGSGFLVLSKAPSPGRVVSTAQGRRAGDSASEEAQHAVASTTDPPPSTTSSTTAPTTIPPTTTTTSPPTTSTTVPQVATGPDAVTGLFATAGIAGYLQSQTSDINAAVYDLDTGQLSEYHPGTTEYTASIVKVDILATLLHQAEQQGVPLSATERRLATTMIENSNDDAATSLWDDAGGKTGVANFNSLIPLPGTIPAALGHWGGTSTNGADQVSLLNQLVQPSHVLTSTDQSYELGLMQRVEPDQAWGVTAGVPAGAGVTVSIKNGWLPLDDDGKSDSDWQVNSIGWVDGDGHNYLIAVLTRGSATEGAGISTIEGLSSLVWNALPART